MSVAGFCLAPLAPGLLLAGGARDSFLFFVGGAGMLELGVAVKRKGRARGFRTEAAGLWKENAGGIEDEDEVKETEVGTGW